MACGQTERPSDRGRRAIVNRAREQFLADRRNGLPLKSIGRRLRRSGRSRLSTAQHRTVPVGTWTKLNFSARAAATSEGDRDHHAGTYRQRHSHPREHARMHGSIRKPPTAPCNHDLDRASQQ
uniref:Uncharacterized protein n=1 Tax=Anopheles culicifacies TaxID=139723 RepID=A0A182M5V6_9DIPT